MDSITIHFQCLLIPTHAADPFPAGLAPDIEGQVFGGSSQMRLLSVPLQLVTTDCSMA